ncbi:hypothetical protein IPM65_01650 [Candidatus Roizmanbacteria bacterium]|nr:MAG: hypothetical protein IPM65_01650 [Candidatus Roizmanbacteria bacterium]
MLNIIENSSVKTVLFAEQKSEQITRDAHPFRPEIRERKKPREKRRFVSPPVGDIIQSRFLF